MQIIPTIFEKDFDEAETKINRVKEGSRWIQVDVTDGVFTPGKTFELELLKKLSFNSDKVLWEIHLMVKEPIRWIEKCIFVGASRICGQVEMMEDREEFVKKIKNEGMEAGLAFDAGTNIDEIPEDTDVILVMGRKAGFGEYPLDETVYKKIEAAKRQKIKIGVDGGVRPENYDQLKQAGADILYLGKYYFDMMKHKT